jgi:hypothetical protein
MNDAIRKLLSVVVTAVALAALFSSATSQARMNLERFPERTDTPSSFELSLTGGTELAWVGPAQACCPQAVDLPLLSAAELSLPGEVIEDVLLAPQAPPAFRTN